LKATDNFFEQVYQVVCLIPRGRVTSYGAIAAYLGSKSGARMVGWALTQLPAVPQEIPAQRVVNRNGLLTGKHHFGTEGQMQRMLEAEGHVIENDCIKNFKTVFWDPAVALAL
jgi:methylated-DNA-protein-cysteine methyltransferase related protein